MPSLFKALLWAAAILAGSLGAGQAASAAPAMWLVKSPHSEIYLFGTLHALTPGDRWRTPLYETAYAKAQTLWFETDVAGADPLTVQNLVARYGVDPQRTLSQKLPAADVAALSRTANLAHLDHLRPWAAALVLSMQPVMAQGGKVEAGADIAVTREARAGDKHVKFFESLEDQARLFADLPEPAEVRYLSDVLKDRAQPHRHSLARQEPLEQAWLDGDLARLGPALVGEMRTHNPALYDALLKRRNELWAARIENELATGDRVELVNVGALHMVGDDGLPALLKARGYAVERVQ